MSQKRKLLPETEVIGGHSFTLAFTETDAEGKPWGTGAGNREFAETDGYDKIIRFNAAQTPKQLHETRIHEYVHAILHTSGLTELLDEKLEEAIAVAMEHGFAPLVTFNRKA